MTGKIWEIVIIMWIMFGVMAGSILIYTERHHNFIMGVSLSPAHLKEEAVQKIVRSFRRCCSLIFGISVLISLTAFLKNADSYADFICIALLLLNLVSNWWNIYRHQKKLLILKEEKGWNGQKRKVVNVDMGVVREKGKSSASPVWVWIFLAASFLPAVWELTTGKAAGNSPLGFLFIGPLCQASLIPLYYGMKRVHAPAFSENTEINKAVARTEERINTRTAVLSSAVLLIFWLFFSMGYQIRQNGYYWLIWIAFLSAGTLVIALWQQRSIRKCEKYFFGEDAESIEDAGDDIPWKWGFYCSSADSRLIVPKRVPGFGWTINMGHPAGKVIAGVFTLFIAGVLVLVVWIGAAGYSIRQDKDVLSFRGAMYHTEVNRSEVASVLETESLPEGVRTNGYGGIKQSYGHFSFEGYGSSMVYMYNNTGKYIVMKLNRTNPSYVIFNEKTSRMTDDTYQKIRQWAGK